METMNILQAIGNTPMVKIRKLSSAHIYAKAEFLNPGGSIKDRVALHMIEVAERDGRLKPDSIIVEPTSGNTGIGLAFVAAALGLRFIATMPEHMSVERRRLMQAFGAEIVLTPAEEGMKGAIAKARELQASIPNSVILDQFANPANPAIHERTTGPEIWEDTEGKLDAFVAGATLHAASALWQYAFDPAQTITAEGVRRAIGYLYGSPNNLSLFLERILQLVSHAICGKQGRNS